MPPNNDKISIIVPTLNEEGNVEALVHRIDGALNARGIIYELIFIDDHSKDRTVSLLQNLSQSYPLTVHLKRGSRGKAQSLLEGFQYARYPLIAIIDADLQYPPEAIPEMIRKTHTGFDIVVANRVEQHISFIRKIISRTFSFVFARMLHGLDLDVQAGLKVFRTQITREVHINPSPWTFDLEFLLNARDCGYTITSVNIVFDTRTAGESKVHLLSSIYEIGSNAIKLKFRRKKPSHIHPDGLNRMAGAGIAHKQKRFITHSTLPHHITAIRTFMAWQKGIFFFAVAVVILGIATHPLWTAIALTAILSAIYFTDVLFNLYLVMRSLSTPPEIHYTEKELLSLDPDTLPVYSVLCPLYREAHILPGFLKAISHMDWPKEKLDILLLLEADDQATIDAARAMDLPSYVSIVVVPHSMPKTKPKACNYGLCFARGEYLVIYDAEDIPDPLQLKKAYLGFQNVPPTVKCLQAKLNYFNPHDNMLTRLFTAEYSLWFDVTLTGLQSINTSIPLGGTSNHFRTQDILDLEGWDPFNVTEDCDLGVRLFKRGYTTAIIDSVTLEEANSSPKNWLRQRSRWIKGYMQTYLVHMRNPITFVREQGIHALVFQLVVGGKIAFMLINPLLWLATVAYFVLYSIVGPTIESLYPPIIFYMAGTSLIFGNFLCLYYYMIGCAKREHWSLVKYVFFVPFYWLMASIAAYIAFWQLLVKPHYWEKTNHGLHLLKKQKTQYQTHASTSRPVVTPHPAPQSVAVSNTIPVIKQPTPAIAGTPLIETPKIAAQIIPKQPRKPGYIVTQYKKIIHERWLLSRSALLVGSMMIANILNFIYSAFLGRALTLEQLGLITFINTIWSVSLLFINPLSSTVNQYSAYYAASNRKDSATLFYRSVFRRGVYIAIVFSVVWVLSIPLLATFFRIQESNVLLFFTPALILGVMAATSRGYLNGTLYFNLTALLIVAEATIKLGVAIICALLHVQQYTYLAVPISIGITGIIGVALARRKAEKLPTTKDFSFPAAYYTASLFSSTASVVFLSVDIILIKHFLSQELAGQYAVLALVGKMIYFFGALPNAFMTTLISRDIGAGRRTKKTFHMLFGITFGLVAIGFTALGLFGPTIVPVLLGEKTLPIIPYLLVYSLAIAFFTLSNSIVSYRLARREYLFPTLSLIMSLSMGMGIIVFHASIEEVVRVMYGVSAISLGSLITLNYTYKYARPLKQNLIDFIGIFAKTKEFSVRPSFGKKRILIFNWRDTRHAFAGGAEIYTHEIAKHWALEGHFVTLFCGNDGKSLRKETVDNVHIIRRGGFYFVYLWAILYYLFRFRKSYDIIIDCQNGIPFFTPLYSSTPVYCLMHHVHQDVFFRSLPRPLALFASFLEKRLMPLVYRNVPFITVSESSKKEILSLGLGKVGGVTVVHPGIHIDQLSRGAKTLHPTILYLGRLKQYKSVDVLIHAFHKIAQRVPTAHLVIAGSGEEAGNLKRLVARLHLQHHVTFTGKVSDQEKIKLLQQAWVMVNPSLMEGWGITTIEANACGTPIVASDVPGLRDSVQNMEAGYLVPYGDADAFAERVLAIIQNKTLRENMERRAVEWAHNFDWQKSLEKFSKLLGTT